MKYSVSIRHPRTILRKADEIKVEYNDIEGIYNFLDEPELVQKRYIIEIKPEDEPDFDKLADLAATLSCMQLALHDLKLIRKCRDYELDWYWAYPIQSYYDLAGIRNLSPCFFLLDAPLYFDLLKVKQIVGDTPIRLIANLAHDINIPRGDGACGTYIRPEDVDLYEPYVDTLEFKTFGPWEERLRKERTLLDIYLEKSWAGNLNLLITNFNINVDNRAFPEDFGKARLQCKQSCVSSTSGCKLCYNIIKTINKLDQLKADWIPGKGIRLNS